MANRFWVGGAGNWDATTTHWSTTSGGSSGATAPGTSDFAVFDASSGGGTATLNAAIAVQGVDFTGLGSTGNYTGTLAFSFQSLTINTANTNAFKLNASMLVTASSGTLIFTLTSGTAALTSAGLALPTITINGVGGTVQQQDNLTVNLYQNAVITLTNGTFDANGFATTCIELASTNSNVRTLKLGSSLTLGGLISNGATVINFNTTTNLTFTKNSCNITILAPATNIASATVTFGALTYNGVTFNASTTGTIWSWAGSATTFGSLSIGAGGAHVLTASTTQTISSAFTIAGTAAQPVMLMTQSFSGAVATLSCPSGSCTLNWGILQGVTAAGGATFTATNTFAVGANTGWAIAAPADGTTAGIVTAVWTDLLSSSDFSTSSSVGALIKALVNLQYPAGAIGRGTATTGASATSVPTSAFSPTPSASVANQLAGRNVLFDATTTTVALRGQMAAISASSASATPTLTVSGLTATPASGDTFSVI